MAYPKKLTQQQKVTCRGCKYSHMPHERGHDGREYLCKCELKACPDKKPPEGPYGWSEFLDEPKQCSTFKERR